MLAPALLLTLLLPNTVPADGPFADLSFDAAVAKAKVDGKLLLVDFMANWCAPCKLMDKQTWPVAEVGTWIAANAVAIQLDSDKESLLAHRFEVESVPTMVFLKDGVELDRRVGFLPSSELLSWAAEVLSAASDPDWENAELERLAASTDPHDLREYARRLAQLGRLREATDAYVKAYQGAMSVKTLDTWKCTTLAQDLADLGERFPPAEAALGALVDNAGRRVHASNPPVYRDWWEWLSLCRLTRRTDDVVSWYEQRRDAQGRLFGGGSFVQEHDVGPPFDLPRLAPPSTWDLDLMRDATAEVLADAGHMRDALALLEDPVQRARERLAKFAPPAGAVRGGLAEAIRLRSVAWLYAFALACGRNDDAALIAGLVRADDPTGEGRVELVLAALDRDVGSRDELEAWLDEAARNGATGESAALARLKLKELATSRGTSPK